MGKKCICPCSDGTPAHLSQWPYTSPTLCAQCFRAKYGEFPWQTRGGA